ncbi:MAG: TonB-dependent siderophore receptor [Cyanobacteria bacterium P01_C01_bin.118]
MAKLQSSINLLAVLTLIGGGAPEAGLAQQSAVRPNVDRIAQVEASLVQITNIQVESTEAGIRVVLETDGELDTPVQSVSGNALVLDISNATLSQQFEEFAPAEGIAVMQVTELPGNQVQVAVTGLDAVPVAEINTTGSSLTMTVVPGVAQVGELAEPLRLVVTGEENSRYVEPNATTATRTDTPLRDIPQSIQVIPQEVLEDQQVIRLEDALRNASGAIVTSAGTEDRRFILRGFGNPAVLRDGFRLSSGGTDNPGSPELANIERVEVLKGPASVLFGSAEPGGVINLVTKQPLSEPFYELGLRGGNREFLEPSLDISGPLTEDNRLLYRLNALYRTEDSFQGRDFDTDFEKFFVAPIITWQISDSQGDSSASRTDFTAYFEYEDSEGPFDIGLVAIGDEVADIPRDRILTSPEDNANSEKLQAGYDFEHRFSENWKIRNAFRYNRFEIETSGFAIVNFIEATGDLFLLPALTGQTDFDYELQTNVVGEFSTDSINHTLLAGIDLYRRDNPLFAQGNFLNVQSLNIFDPVYGSLPDLSTTPILVDFTTRIDSLGIYLQDQIDLTDNLILLLGGRYETTEQTITDNITDTETSNQNDDAFSPRVGLVYQPIEELSLYGSYSTSFVPNSATTIDGDLLDPEEGEQFEVGAKAELLDGRLTANLALFHITKQNVATPDPNDPLGIASVATGEQRSQGVELDVAGEILSGWNIIANYAYTDADITEDNSGLEGNRLFGVPEHNFNLWTTYDIQTGPLEGLGFGFGVNYVDERFGDNANTFTLDDYFLTNAAISYQQDNWQAGLNFRNLFDVDYFNSNNNRRSIFVGEDFTVIGSFSVTF